MSKSHPEHLRSPSHKASKFLKWLWNLEDGPILTFDPYGTRYLTPWYAPT